MRHYGLMKCLAAAGCLCALAAGLLDARLEAQETVAQEEHVFQLTSQSSKLQLIDATSRIIQVRGRIKVVDGFDPDVIETTVLPGIANQIRVIAKKPGVTALFITDEFGTRYTVEISVIGDVRQLEAVIQRAFPDANVKAIKVNDAILLTGWVNQQDQLTPIVEVAEQFATKVLNYMKVGGVQQVMLRVKIMEVQRTRIRQLGLNFIATSKNGFLTSTPGLLTPLNSITAPLGSVPDVAAKSASLASTTATFGIIGSDAAFLGFVEALKQEKLLQILAEPNLVTINGRPANFLSGGEIPIPVPQGLGTVTIQWRDFGVRVEFVPYVLGAGRMRLEVSPEVSNLDPTNGTSLNGTSVPAITTRRVNTQVEMNFGQSLVIAGLINSQAQGETDKIPFLGELPWIGAAFRRVKRNDAETELLIMVTPELVAPLDPGQVLAEGPGMHSVSPTDRELYGLGILETPKTGDDCAGCVGGPAGVVPPQLPTPPGGFAPGTAAPSELLPPPITGPVPDGGAMAEPPRASTRPRDLPSTRQATSAAVPGSRPDARLQQMGGNSAKATGGQARRPLPGLIAPAVEAAPEP